LVVDLQEKLVRPVLLFAFIFSVLTAAYRPAVRLPIARSVNATTVYADDSRRCAEVPPLSSE